MFYQSEKKFDPNEIKIDQNEIGIYLNETEFYALFIGNLIYVYVKESSEIQFSTDEGTFQLALSRWLNKVSQQRVIL